jgi:hypothetical protein
MARKSTQSTALPFSRSFTNLVVPADHRLKDTLRTSFIRSSGCNIEDMDDEYHVPTRSAATASSSATS